MGPSGLMDVPLKNMIFAVSVPSISVTSLVPSETPSRWTSKTTSIDGYFCRRPEIPSRA